MITYCRVWNEKVDDVVQFSASFTGAFFSKVMRDYREVYSGVLGAFLEIQPNATDEEILKAFGDCPCGGIHYCLGIMGFSLVGTGNTSDGKSYDDFQLFSHEKSPYMDSDIFIQYHPTDQVSDGENGFLLSHISRILDHDALTIDFSGIEKK